MDHHSHCHKGERGGGGGGGGCACVPSLGFSQDLDEMEFERGIWGAALNGDLSKVQRLLRTSKNNAHARDSSGIANLFDVVQ